MRYQNFAEKEYYHLYARGIEKIFIDKEDYSRFIFLVTHLQSPTKIHNVSWYAKNFVKKDSFGISSKKAEELLKNRSLELISFVLMPNHFHLLVYNIEEALPSVYMHRILTSYSKYYNAKYKKKGHVFDGPFGAVHIKDNTQLLHLSAYIHKNPTSINGIDLEKYEWSSYPDYIGINRWENLLKTDHILGQFDNQAKYKEFVKTSTAKELF